MAKLYQNNFVGGEISPSLYARSDLAAYYKGCAKAENFTVTQEGSLRKRHGISSFLELTGVTSADEVKIVPYTFDRFNGGFLLISSTGSTLTAKFYRKNGTTYELSDTATIDDFKGNLTDIQSKQIGDQVWLVNGLWYKVITVNDNETISPSDWEPDATPAPVSKLTATGHKSDGTSYSPSSGRTISYCAHIVKNGVLSDRKTVDITWPTTWTAGYYINVTVTIPQALSDSGDFDYVILGKKVGSLYGEISRWYPEDFDNATSITYNDENVSGADAIYPQTDTLGSGWKNPLCLDCFQQRKVYANAQSHSEKRHTLTTASDTWTSPDGIYDLVSVKYGSTDYTDQCTVEGATITFPSSKKWVVTYNPAEAESLPMTLWFSEVGNIDNFYADRPAADDDPFSPTIMSTGPAFIRHLAVYQEQMIALTDCGLFSFSFSQTSGFSASSCRICRFSDIVPAPNIQPVVTAAGLIFIGADQKTLYTITFDIQDNALKPSNRSVLVEHLTRRAKITSISMAQYPQNVIYATLSDGTFATFTFERDQEVYAWSSNRLCIEGAHIHHAIATGACTEITNDRTYSDLVFLVSTAEGFFLAQLDPRSMKDTIGTSSHNVVATLVTLRPEMQDRTIVGVPKNIHDTLIRVFETGTIKLRTANGDLEQVYFNSTEDTFTGDIKLMPRGFVNDFGQLEIVSDDDKTAEILAVCQKLEMGT